MSKTCTCPVPTCIATFSAVTCPVDASQIQKLIFWRRGNEIADVAALILSATWSALKAATDSTKAVVSPFIEAPTFEIGDFVEEGSGNEVRDGIPHIKGSGNTKFTCKVYSPSSAILREFKELECETLDVIFVNENGHFVHHVDLAADVQGFQVVNLGVKDRMIGGYQASDYFDIVFYLRPNWSDYLTITDPTANFSALDL
jgi:hypothetical protein